ncbi:MAG: cell division protein FtsH, partial [Anaerolineae bacterium]|nr:cell division protein FtsH [Anaerolineae bacterium]
GMEEFEEAVERVVAGPERRSRIISEEEKRIIAYHEAGHALVRYLLPKADPIAKVSIVARGMSLGHVRKLPERDFVLISQSKLEDEMAAILGGRAAEEIIFRDVTDGATDDLEKATRMARAMVTQYGMSRKLGPLQFGRKDELIFLGREIMEQRNYSEKVAREIDAEIQRLVETAYNHARGLILTHRDKLDAIVQKLLEEETLERDELDAILQDVAQKVRTEQVPV